MAEKIEKLVTEINRQGTLYSDILVGMHADINVYKRKVELQGEETEKVLRSVKETATEVATLKNTAEVYVNRSAAILESLEDQNSEMNSVSTAFYERLDAYSQQLENYEAAILNKTNSAITLMADQKEKMKASMLALEVAHQKKFDEVERHLVNLGKEISDYKEELDTALALLTKAQEEYSIAFHEQLARGIALTKDYKKDTDAELAILQSSQITQFNELAELLAKESMIRETYKKERDIALESIRAMQRKGQKQVNTYGIALLVFCLFNLGLGVYIYQLLA